MRKESIQLGINYSTAQNRLRKQLLFKYIKLAKDNICFVCKKEIDNINELSIEHKIPWLNHEKAKELFWDNDNLAFSHLSCNSKRARKQTGVKHPSIESYKRGCRCSECKEKQRKRMRLYRARLI